MRAVEQNWEDITIYSVEFISVLDPKVTRKFRKILVFPSSIPKEEIVYLVPYYLQGIEKILHIEELEKGFLLRG